MHVSCSCWLATLLLLVAVLCAGPRVEVQSIAEGAVIGVMADPQVALIPEAAVTATNAATGVVLRTTSPSVGNFSFHAVPIAIFQVQIQSGGFRMAMVDQVQHAADLITDLTFCGPLRVPVIQRSIFPTGKIQNLTPVPEVQVRTGLAGQVHRSPRNFGGSQ
jgi:hypothetical protein